MSADIGRQAGLAFASTFMAAARRTRGFNTAGNPVHSSEGVARRIAFLSSVLTLTTAQASQANTIFTSSAAAITPLQTGLSEAQTFMCAAVAANNITQIDELSVQIGSLTGQVTALQNKAEALFYGTLAPEQRTRHDAIGAGRGGDF